jgi:hypothetical protein
MPTIRFMLSAVALPVFMAVSTASFADAATCVAPPSWFSSVPAMPTKVAKSDDGGTSSSFCDFYQFSWQGFLHLMGKNKSGAYNFENTKDYPLLEMSSDGMPVNSCDTKIQKSVRFTSLNKGERLPASIHQAGDGATIYDQKGNVVFYDVRFSRNLCDDANAISKADNFPEGTTEFKTAWRVLTDENSADYITIKADIGTEPKQKNVVLGLIGFHLAIATTDHPEFVWATFEHRSNSPDCTSAGATGGWSFASNTCSDALNKGGASAIKACDFNNAKKEAAFKGKPTEICRVFPYGTDASDNNAGENLSSVVGMNLSVAEQLPANSPLRNYFNVGALWVSDITQSSTVSNQRGSLRLANTVAETTYQHVDLNASFVSNCFGCHGYAGTAQAANKNTTASVSHIFTDITAGLGITYDVEVGPIFDQAQAEKICPSQCFSPNEWNGQWTTTEVGVMSVCGCSPKK